MKLGTLVAAGFVGVLMLSAPIVALVPADTGILPTWNGTPSFNGFGSYAPANGWDAPIFRQFALVEGRVTQYHVLSPETFLMDAHHSRIYQFPICSTLAPVLELHEPTPGDGGFWGPHDAPTREIVDVVLTTGCSRQPTSEAEVFALATEGNMVPRGLFVNAPIVPPQLADLPDLQLFNGPPFRPRIDAWQDGKAVKFFTYEASWYAPWAGTNTAGVPTSVAGINWPGEDGTAADVFMISYGAMFRPGFTIFNTAAGTPLDASSTKYSPIWRANCIVDGENPKCMVSVNLLDPAYYQCRSAAECKSMVNSNGVQVVSRGATTFTHINCPMVSVDVTADDYIAVVEEIVFPDLWVNGPVLV